MNDVRRKNYEYNGKKLTEYEATQTQRHIERQIRKYKREIAGFEAAGIDSTESRAWLKKWQQRQRDFIDQTGLKRDYSREIVEGYKGKKTVANSKKSGIIKAEKINKSVKIPDDCTHLLKADTNFENKNISEEVLRAINRTIDQRLSENNDFRFDEIKVAKFTDTDKSVFITNYEVGVHNKIQLYLNQKYFIGISEKDLNDRCMTHFNSKWWKSKNLEDLVNHEIMHAKINYGHSYEKVEALYQRLSEDNRLKGFCRLVDKDGSEFLNEMYVAINSGEKIEQKYLKIYNEYINDYFGG